MNLHFPSLAQIPNLRHAVTTREGGVSQGEFGSLNLGFHVQDDLADVRENRRLAGELYGYDASRLVAAQQVHGADYVSLGPAQAGNGAFGWDDAIPNADAIVTGARNLPLLIQVADCAPILLADADSDLFAVVHAGWRGALAGIAGKTADFMRSDAIFAAIGPCLCPACLEVGPEVAAEVETIDPAAVLSGWDKPHLDLRGLIQRDLERVGVAADRIEIMDRCPRCEPETFFSHRAQAGKAGRFGIVAWRE